MSKRQDNYRSGGRYGGSGGGMYDRNQRPALNPWQQNPTSNISSLLPLGSSSTQATLALANNLISNLLQTRTVPAAVPSLLDMPLRRDFDIDPRGHFGHRSYGNMRMGNQGNFRRPQNTVSRFNDNRKQKSDGPRNKTTPKKEGADKKSDKPQESSVKSKAEKEVNSQSKESEEAGETPKTAYDDINPDFLECHICNKRMWDGRSFENHINGRAHNMMMIKTNEGYALVVETMRQELKINDMKMNRHNPQSRKDFFCNMCNMYASNSAYHRHTAGHRKLKKYLHPACNICHKEMPNRIDLDKHLLTPEHMRKLQETQEQTGTRKVEPHVISTLSNELAYIEEGLNRKRNYVMRIKAQQARLKAAKNDGKYNTEDVAETEDPKSSDQLEDALLDTEATVVDYTEGDDLSEMNTEKLPVYHTQRAVGKSFIGNFVCKQCTLCDRLLDSEETAEAHTRTRKHHHMFLKMLEEKSGKDLMVVSIVYKFMKRTSVRMDCTYNNGFDAKRRKANEQNREDGKQDAENETKGTEQDDGNIEMPIEEEDWEKDLSDILNSEGEQQPGQYDQMDQDNQMEGQGEGQYDFQGEEQYDFQGEGEYDMQGEGEIKEGQNEVEEVEPAEVPTPESATPSRRPVRRRTSRI